MQGYIILLVHPSTSGQMVDLRSVIRISKSEGRKEGGSGSKCPRCPNSCYKSSIRACAKETVLCKHLASDLLTSAENEQEAFCVTL
jgi:hypothetical protein